MGLDMFLYARKEKYNFEDSTNPPKLPEELQMFNDVWDKSITVQTDYTIGYWRKANHIHKWFVDNCGDGEDNCQEMFINRDQIEQLLNLCKEVLEEHDKANTLLPTQKGFFFGDTNYDEYYFRQTKRTKDICERVLQFIDEREKAKDYWSIVYDASW